MSTLTEKSLKVSVSKLDPKAAKAPKTLAVLVAKGVEKDTLSHPKLSKELKGLLDAAQAAGAFSGNKKESVFFRSANVDGFENIAFVGLGSLKDINTDLQKTAGAILVGKLKAEKIKEASVLGTSVGFKQKNEANALQNFAEGLLLSVYEYNDLKSSTKKPKENGNGYQLERIDIAFENGGSAVVKKAVEAAQIVAECQNFARRLGDTPGNYMTPSILASETAKAAKGTKLKVTSWDKARIKKEGFGGLLAVAAGSAEEPRFIMMEYKGAAASKKPLCFVGKGLTFDTGGISIKPGQSMEEMKYDMCGGAAVIGAMLAIARLGLKVNVIAFVPSTENMPGPTAFKPGDVYTARNGKTVEVFNTDAEGRLILGDALAYASEQKPAAIVDTATLTGAILIALGNHMTGAFTRDKILLSQVQEAADAAGELIWHLPIDDFHVEDIKGNHADLCNITNTRLAGSSTAAAFLEQFVEKDIPWIHLDIAGTAWNVNSRFPYHPRKGASGIMVRTFVELAKQF